MKKRDPFFQPPRLSTIGIIVNWVMTPLDFFRIGWEYKRPITLERLENLASKETKLFDFGDDWYRSKFDHCIAIINTYKITALGRKVMMNGIKNKLQSKLRLNARLKVIKESLRPLDPPCFVLGLPRTGTTFLHNLLSLDSRTRCPKCYELHDPAPLYPDDPVKDKAVRIKRMAADITTIKTLVPHIDDIHEVGADYPDECFMAMSMDVPLLPSTFRAVFAKPEIVINEWDMRRVYTNYYKVLQLLEASVGEGGGGGGGEQPRWILKSPAHLGFVDSLSYGFPGSTLIWTHRDPAESIGSLCSLFRTCQETFYAGDVDMKEIGQQCCAFWEAMLRKADMMFSADEGMSARTQHVLYRDFIKDPIITVQKIYDGFGWDYSDRYDTSLKDYIAASKVKRAAQAQGKAKLHSYSLEEFGLDGEEMRKRLAWYYEKYLGE